VDIHLLVARVVAVVVAVVVAEAREVAGDDRSRWLPVCSELKTENKV
jgi:hypothetical protein